MLQIEEAIQDIRNKLQNKRLGFPLSGLGQALAGYDIQGKKFKGMKEDVYPAPLTFMYLSQRLFEEFNYVNPHYTEMELPDTTGIVRDPSKNIEGVDLRKYAENKLAVSDEELGTDTIMMNLSQGAIGFPIPVSDKDAVNVAADYRRAMVQNMYGVPPESYSGMKTIWIFGNKIQSLGNITQEKIASKFEANYRPEIDKAIDQGVTAFNISDKGTLSDLVHDYLTEKGFTSEDKSGWTQYVQAIEGSKGPLPFINEAEADMIKKGTKTTIWTEQPLKPGKYTLPDGTIVRLTDVVRVDKILKGKGEKPVAGSMAALGLDITAELKAGGYNTRAKTAERYGKFAQKFVDNEGTIYINRLELPTPELDKEKAIKVAEDMLGERMAQIKELLKRETELQENLTQRLANKEEVKPDDKTRIAYATVQAQRMALERETNVSYEGDKITISNDEGVEQDFSSYEDLFNKYNDGEITLGLEPQAKDMLNRMNLLSYLSNVEPEDEVIEQPADLQEIKDPGEVIKTKSLVTDKELEEQIMSCIKI
jgi:hypothetical protein